MKPADLVKLGLVGGAAYLAANAIIGRMASSAESTPSSDDRQSRRRSHAQGDVQRSPKGRPPAVSPIKRKTVAAAPTTKERMLIEHGPQAAYTWATIARAENDLRTTSLRAMALREPPFLLSDCFTDASQLAKEYSYTLRVTSTKEAITVGGFQSDTILPRQVSECLDEAFAGEATIEKQAPSEDAGDFLEFEMVLHRQDVTALATARAIESSSREDVLESAYQVYTSEPVLSQEEQELQDDLGLSLEEFKAKRGRQ